MAQPERPLSPFMQYRWQYTNTLSILHRITGILLSLCFFVLVYWLAAAAAGPERYSTALQTLGSPLVKLSLVGGLFSFCYHLLNGIRHLFWDAGYGFELPTMQATGYGVLIGTAVLTLLAWGIGLSGGLG